MRKTLIFIALFLLPCFVFCQYNVGWLETPNIPFPKSIMGYRYGFLYLNYNVDRYGTIKSLDIALIRMYDPKTSKKKSTELPCEVVYDAKFPKRNTKAGLELAEKIKPWLKEFGNKTKFIKGPDWYEGTEKKPGGGIWGHEIEIGPKALKKIMKKKFLPGRLIKKE